MSYLDRVVDDELCTLILETMDDGAVHVHLNMYRWSKGAYEEMLLTWMDVLSALRKKAVKTVYATAPADEPDFKTLRFQMMFGFTPISMVEDKSTSKQFYLSEVVL